MSSSPLPNVVDAQLYTTQGLFQFTVASIIIATLSLGLRFWARWLSEARYGLDDWLALGAYPPVLAVMVINGLELQKHGLGMESDTITPDELTAFKKLLYAAQICWHVGTSMLRFSALAFYFRIFHVRSNPSRIWTKFYWLTVAVSMIWLIGVFLMYSLLLCNPVSKFWYASEPGSCVPQFNLFIAGTAGSALTDIMIVFLPLPQVFKLNMKLRRKFGVSFTFLLAYAAAFMSIGRLAVALELGYTITTDTFVALVAYFYWICGEAGFTVLAICIPAIFHLTKHVRSIGPSYLIGGKGTDLASISSVTNNTNRGMNHPERINREPDWDNLYDGPGFGTYVTVSGGGSKRPILGNFGNSPSEGPPPSDGIAVTRDVDITMTDFV